MKLSNLISFSFMLFGDKILLLRKFVGLQQKELAAKIGAHDSRLSDYERDVYSPSAETLALIADTCGIHIGYFFDNLLPADYYEVAKDLKYAYYLSQLPEDVRRYQKKMLKHAYKVRHSDVDKAGKNILMNNRKNKFLKAKKIKPFHEDYFKELRKRAKVAAPGFEALTTEIKASADISSVRTKEKIRNNAY